MVLIQSDKAQISRPSAKVKCKACNKKLAGIWPDQLCIDCYIIAEKMRTHEPI